MMGASDAEAREFAAGFRSFLEWVHSEDAGAWECNEVVAAAPRDGEPATADHRGGDDDAGRYVVIVSGPAEHDQGLGVEIAGLSVEAAQGVHARLGELRSRLNVYRGHVLDVSRDSDGRGGARVR